MRTGKGCVMAKAKDIRKGDVIQVDGTAFVVDKNELVDDDGNVAITYKRGTRSGIRVRHGSRDVKVIYKGKRKQ